MKINAAKDFAIVTLSIMFVAGLTIGSAAAQKPSGDTPATSLIDGAGVYADPTVANYRVQSDQRGPYKNGIDSVSSIIQTNRGQNTGDWTVSTLTSAARALIVDLRDAVPGTNATPPFSYLEVPTRIIVKGHETSSTSFGRMIGLGATILAPMTVRFEFDRSSYRLNMDPNPASFLLFPGTDYVRVTCTGVVDPSNPSQSQCNEWRVEPSVTQSDGQLKNKARLTRLSNKGDVTLGDYYMSFAFRVTTP